MFGHTATTLRFATVEEALASATIHAYRTRHADGVTVHGVTPTGSRARDLYTVTVFIDSRITVVNLF